MARTKHAQSPHFGIKHGLVRSGHVIVNSTPPDDRAQLMTFYNEVGYESIRQARRFMRIGTPTRRPK